MCFYCLWCARARIFALFFCLSLKKVSLKTRVLENVWEIQKEALRSQQGDLSYLCFSKVFSVYLPI